MGDNSKHGSMPLNKTLQEKSECLEACVRSQDRCETGSPGSAKCRDRFERCTTLCDLDYG